MADIRKIIHCDCDCFYASIEVRDNPALAGLPVAVGGSPDRRGVVATCNYEARRFGVHSAMASATARRLCPELVIIRPDMERYRRASHHMHRIFRDYTDVIEPLSLDEAFLDVTHCNRCNGSATRMAEEIRARVRSELGITVSAGIAPNKFLAKVASDWNKPDGQFVVTPEQVEEFVRDLPVKKLLGVGKVTAARMEKLAIHTCADLRQLDMGELEGRFGKFGKRLYDLCRGIDDRPVQTSRVRKSLSVEKTFPRDLPDLAAVLDQLPDLMHQLAGRMQAALPQYRVVRQFVKMKFSDFVTTTVETTSTAPEKSVYANLLQDGFARGQRPVRLLGLGVGLLPLRQQLPDAASQQPEDTGSEIESRVQLALLLDETRNPAS